MSLPWLKDDYKRPDSRSRSRSRSGSRSGSGSRSRRLRSEEGRSRRSRSRSPQDSRDFPSRGRDGTRGRGGSKRGGSGRSPDRSKRRRSRSSSSGSSNDSRTSATRLVASNRQKYVNARIFVANISSKDLTKSEIVSHFEKYGNVVDCLIHPKNYIFVQYLKEEHARLAVEGEHGSTFNGFRIDVKMANENRKSGPPPMRDPPNRDGMGPNDQGRPPRDPYGPDPFIHDRRPPPPFPPPPGDYSMRDPYFPPDPYRRGYPPDPWLPPEDPYRRDPYADPYRDSYASRLPPPVPVGPVECEIFIVNPQLRTYGEIIERKVKDQSIITALSIIPEGRTAPQMVEDLTAKGGLFAIFLNAQNEAHRSLTLNILHGTPQEHRNMPLDDAIGLIGRSFEKYVEELRAKANANTAASSSASVSGVSRVFLPPSSEVTYLLNLLADNRALTVAELETVIKYLQERRDKLVDADKRPLITDDVSLSEKKVKEEKPKEVEKKKETKDDQMQATHEELTKKILSIFQGVDPSIASKLTQASASTSQVPAPQPAPAPAPPPPPSKTSGSGSGANLINFDNPNVQKALDNLIQSGPNLLKNFAASSSSQSPVSSAAAISSKSMRINSAPSMPNMGNVGDNSGMGMGMMHQNQGDNSGMGMGMMHQSLGDNSGMGMGMMHPNSGMDMGMFGQLGGMAMDEATQAALAAAFNMPGMGGPPMGGQGVYNFPPMPRGGPPPPPPPNQRY